MIVDLAVVYQPVAPVARRHRLPPSRSEVDDRQAPVHEHRRPIGRVMLVAIVGTSVRQASIECVRQTRGVGDTIETDEACKTTHMLNASAIGRGSRPSANAESRKPRVESRGAIHVTLNELRLKCAAGG
jgi:hypothetical protein